MGISDGDLKCFLKGKKEYILSKWFEEIISGYPDETVKILKREKDRFSNPLGINLYEGITGIYSGILEGIDPENISPYLDQVIRIRAVQDFLPSQAVKFLVFFKKFIREEFAGKIKSEKVFNEWVEFDLRIDELILLSLDVFSSCREKIFEIKLNENKSEMHQLLQRANLLFEGSQDKKSGNTGSDRMEEVKK